MQLTISKKDLQFIRDLVKDSSDNCKRYGFGDNDDLIDKLDKALARTKKSKRKSPFNCYK